MHKTIILGAGLSGLGAAHAIPGAVVYEAKDHPGGHAWSHEKGGVFYDEGAHICHSRDEAWRQYIFQSAGDVEHIQQSLVGNAWKGQWFTYPVQNHLRELPESLRVEALRSLVAAQVAHRDDAPSHYADWVRFQYGAVLAETFYRPYTDKYWRTPMEEMDIDWLAGRLLPAQLDRIVRGSFSAHEETQSVFSTFAYPKRGGFFAFFQDFHQGMDIRYKARLREVDPAAKRLFFENGASADYDRLVSTIPLPDLVHAVRGAPAGIREAAATLKHTRLLVVGIVVARPRLSPYHWFYVYDPHLHTARVKVLSNLIPAACPPDTTVLQCEIFRRNDEPMHEEDLRRAAVEEMAGLLGFDAGREVRSVDTVSVSHAYPVPLLGRREAVEKILEWLRVQGIVSTGLYGQWKYVWSDEAYRLGGEVGRRLATG